MLPSRLRTAALALGLVIAGAACAANGGGVAPVPLPYHAVAASKIEISGIGTNAALDRMVAAFMTQQHVPNAQLAVSAGGRVTFSHAYTYRGLAVSTTTRATVMRLASNSKAWTSAALYDLISAGKIDPSWRVFRYLGITKPLPAGAHVDPRVYDITIEEMIQHESGWDDSVSPYYDPTFAMRRTALALGLTGPIDQTQEVRYQLHWPLQEAPGTKYAYCNFCYTVLGMVVAKASGTTYSRYLASLGARIGVSNVAISPTVGTRLPNEVASYVNPYSGPSALYVTSNKPYPYPHSGDGMLNEVAEGAGGLATSADSMLALMDHYIIWGVGTPPPLGYDWAREGEMPGTNTWAEQLPNGTHYAFLVNTNRYVYGKTPTAFTALQADIEHALDPAAGPRHPI